MPQVPQLGITALTRHEPIADISLTALNTEYQLPTRGGLVPSDRYLWGIRLMFEGRATNPAANGPTGLTADERFGFIENISVEGYHRLRGAQEQFVNVRGPDLREEVRIYTSHVPHSAPAAALSVIANATNDIRFIIDVPFVPLALPWRAQMGWLLDAPNYESLTLKIRYADCLNVFTGQTVQPAMTAFGVATGSPQIRVSGIFCLAGAGKFAGYVPGRVYRYFQEVTGSDATTTATEKRLYNFPRGFWIRSLLVKTGTKQVVTAGNNAYATLIDTMLTEIKVMRGTNTINRHFRSAHDLREDSVGISSSLTQISAMGYGLIDWVKLGADFELLDTRGLVAGPTGDVEVFLQANVLGAANQAALFVVEEWRHRPVTLVRR